MNKWPKITIAIPTFNEGQRIEACLRSIFSQGYRGELEVLVVDDNSTDDTVIRALKFPIRTLTNGHRNQEYGKKIGLDHAAGEFFMYLDADIRLVGRRWFDKMLAPLLADQTVVASFTRFVSQPTDTPLNRYISLDFLQRDPLFIWLTPRLSQVMVEEKPKWKVCEYSPSRMLPAGLCLYRRSVLKQLVGDKKKFMELDTIAVLVKHGLRRFGYVPSAGLHHPFVPTLRVLVAKRWRNLKTMYFHQPEPREWLWIDWHNKWHVAKVILWFGYANTWLLPAMIGLAKSLWFKTWVGMYEPVVVWLTTSLVALSFLAAGEGRRQLTAVWRRRL